MSEARPWEADVHIDVPLAARMVRDQFQDLAGAPVSALGEGFDNLAVLADDAWVFRFPRRHVGAELLAVEQRFAAHLAPQLPLPISAPTRFGAPQGAYPYAFSGYRALPGTTGCRVAWTDATRAQAAEPLGAFLAALHSVPPRAAPSDPPRDTLRRADLGYRRAQIVERSKRIAHLPWVHATGIAALAGALATTPPHDDNAAPCWVHGDLYPRHVLFDAKRLPCGVIDWGDLHLGDPAIDLALGWMLLPRSAHVAFQRAYGGVDAACWRRARFRALFYGVALSEYGVSVEDTAMAALGADILARI